jgi:hypothetical protein
MWHPGYSDRLIAWNRLRSTVCSLPLCHALENINLWWMKSPWQPYYLHWDDRHTWPDPWQLLEDNVFCSLARGLGMLYTLAIIDHKDIHDCVLIENESGNLVQINGSKYILNWEIDQIVNISPGITNPKHQITLTEIKQKIY